MYTSRLMSAIFIGLASAFSVGRDYIVEAVERIAEFIAAIQIEAPRSIELDTVAHQTRMVDTDDGSHAKRVMAFRKRASEHKLFSAGGFALDASLSAA